MRIHFVCTGNTYRSRLAETYLRSKEIPVFSVSSSGVMANANMNGPVSWYTSRLLKYNGMLKHISMSWTQTSQELLQRQDLIIFMEPFHLDQARSLFNYTGDNFEVWNIEDIDNELAGDRKQEALCLAITESTFDKIRAKVDDLTSRIGKKT